jgi:hypothetical protein
MRFYVKKGAEWKFFTKFAPGYYYKRQNNRQDKRRTITKKKRAA